MTNTPIPLTSLAAITPVSTDLIYVLSDPAGTPLGKKATFANLATAIGCLPLAGGTMTGDPILEDNVELLLGTGSDASLSYDGTDLLLDPAKVGSGKLVLADNKKIALGTGKDAEIYYDGTDLFIDPDVVGSGKVKIGGEVDLDADNRRIWFGAGGDASIRYNGTNLNIDTDVVGTGGARFSNFVNAVGGFKDAGVDGIDQVVAIDTSVAATHTLTFGGGIITAYSVV